jgi:phage terminase large subunit
MFTETQATHRILQLNKKIRAVCGGTSASKTISILLYLIAMAQTDTKPTLTSIVSESFPHLKRGAMRDFLNILKEHNYYQDKAWNRTDSIYMFETGSTIEFFSVDQPDKLRGARRDRLFINEANNTPVEAFDQLEVRTKEFVFLDWNPSNEFWFYTDILPHRNDVDFITLTYRDNDALSPEIIASIEARKHNVNWWRVYGEGQLGEVEGRIYTGWRIIDEIPHEAKLVRRWLDFGYTVDPTAIGDIYYLDGGYILDERMYQKGMLNKPIADFLLSLEEPATTVVGDSAEPKSIDEIYGHGVNIIPCVKGRDSIRNGIATVQEQKISVTKRSLNLLKEYRNYMWDKDKQGRTIPEPIDFLNHHMDGCFAGDTLIKTTQGLTPIKDLVGKCGFVYSRNGMIKPFHSVRATRYNTDVCVVFFTDGSHVRLTPDHLLLMDNGMWTEAQLLKPHDMIQSDMYGGYTHISKEMLIQWQSVLSLWEVLFKRLTRRKKATQSGVDIPQRGDTQRTLHSPQGREQTEQQHSQSGNKVKRNTYQRTLDGRVERKTANSSGEDKTLNKGVARIKRGERVALITWEGDLPKKKTIGERMRALPYEIHNYTVRIKSKILQSKLQNESTQKTVERIERGHEDVVFNLEVDDTHCLVADGVIAHNCRYAITSLKGESNPVEQIRQSILNIKHEREYIDHATSRYGLIN